MALSLQRYTMSEFDAGLNRILKERSEKERETSPVLAIKIGGDLPENVIVEILSWLPVKAVLRFKSVCKSWYAIVSRPDFISKHLKNYCRTKNKDGDSNCLLVQYYVSHAELQLFEVLVDETPRFVAKETLYSMPMYGSYVCGPCDGIYYLYDYERTERALWNPAANKLKELPSIINKPNLPSNLTYAKSDAYGFGYDPVSEDYKVVVLKGYWPASDDESVTHPLSVLVYSLKADSWRYWGDLAQDYELKDNKCYMFLNGCYYWLVSCFQLEYPEIIISFDMSTDTVQEMHVPDHDQPASKGLAICDDSLAFLAVSENTECLDIWTWNEGLWTKKLTMGPIPGVARPVGHWKKNKIIVECDYLQLILCDIDTQEIKDLAFQGEKWCEGLYVYQESLLSVNDRNMWGHSEQAEPDANQD